MGLLRTVRNRLRADLWPLPTVALAVAVVAGLLVPQLDGLVDPTLPGWLSGVLFGGDSGAARTLLDTISSSLITVTSLTFSLTVVTLQLASSQFSPRLLRTFTRDLFVQATLALFLSTFIFSLTVLRSVRSTGSGVEQFVPRIAVSLAFLLAVGSVLTLVLFLAHLTEQIRVETMLRNVHEDASATLQDVLPERDRSIDLAVDELGPRRPEDPLLVSSTSGFLTRVDESELVAAAREIDAIVVLTAHPGSFLVEGVPIGFLRLGPLPGSGDAVAGVHDTVARAVHTGFERTESQDVGYGLRQLTDVTNKALSPGINDPTTAVHALGHVSALLCDLAERQLGATLLRDGDSRVRVVLCRPTFADLVELAIGQPRRYGAADHQVVTRLFLLLDELAARVAVDQHHVVSGQLGRLRRTADGESFDETERSSLAALGRQVEQTLASRGTG